tara:strand:- start:16993 stop:17310 length:318 start_codon:yes stop_codon:yes gene_type:complete
MALTKEQKEVCIFDAIKHLEDGRLGTDTDTVTVELGLWTHEVLEYGDCAESTNECIDMAIELLESVLEDEGLPHPNLSWYNRGGKAVRSKITMHRRCKDWKADND